MNKNLWLFIVILLQASFVARAERPSTNVDSYAKASSFMAHQQYHEAIKVMEPLAKINPNYHLLISLGNAYAELEKPQKALDYYQRALQLSTHRVDKQYALFRIAKIQFWLGKYVSAEKTYRLLLTYPLTPKEQELALAGLVKSLAYYNRPRTALQQIPPKMVYTTPDLVIASSQATLWANWADRTKSILTTYQPITRELNRDIALGRDLKDLQWQTKLATTPHVITPTVFASHDSEDFSKTRTLLDYSHYWNQRSQTAFGLDYIRYTQYQPNKLNASGIYLGQTFRPGRYVILHGQIEPTVYNNLSPRVAGHWSPLLWDAYATFTPNDYVSFRLQALKEVIETFPAFANHISDNQYAGSLAVNPLPYVQVNGAYSRLNMSDTNNRNIYFLSSTVLVLPDIGLSTTGTLRAFTDQFTSMNYFSPSDYRSATILMKLGRKLGATWHYYIDGGVGRQFITPKIGAATVASPTYQWGLGITGPMTSWLVLNAYYADVKQASAFIDSSDYHYQYGGISLNIML